MTATAAPRGAGSLREQDPKPGREYGKTAKSLGGIAGWVDDRSGAAKPFAYFMKKVFPDHWSFMLGEIAMFSLVVVLVTGTFLTFWFVPSAGEVVYDGSYVPLRGVVMSEAYKSSVDISFDIRGGLIIRQIHHWSALMFTVSIMVHMFRVFFTGAFRKPREINWIIGVLLSMLGIIEGFAGYSLPDDLLSGTGLRAAEGFMQSIPVIGSYVAYFLFGGPFPGEAIIPRLFTIHVLLVPAIIVGLFIAHLSLVIIHKHTQYPGPGKTNDNVVGFPMMPVYMAKAGGFLFIVFGLTALISALVTINPIWMYGPYDPSPVTAGSQPDWYMGFADGALRLLPGFFEFTAFGFTFSMNVFIPAILLIPLLYGIAGAYPFIEAWVTGDKQEHHLLDRPRNAPTRTGLGVMALVTYGILFFAAGNDLMAIKLHLSINDITNMLRLSLLVLPPLSFWVTKRICMSLQRRDRDLVLHGRETGRIVRTADGLFFEVHEALGEYERWRLVQHTAPRPLELAAAEDANGVRRPGTRKERLRAWLSNFYFADTIEPVTPAELAAAHHDGEAYESLAIEAGTDYEHGWAGGDMHGGADTRGWHDAYAPHGTTEQPEPDEDAARAR
ncbi:MAG TPA: ubiquinol-cytochrome c reductase cytochrome b subunit [Dermatophilaceae bacterium]|nr:ubiquinol-cytochrome c reductase cytochrome b subunit [Dermatophilaceae bacterium]